MFGYVIAMVIITLMMINKFVKDNPEAIINKRIRKETSRVLRNLKKTGISNNKIKTITSNNTPISEKQRAIKELITELSTNEGVEVVNNNEAINELKTIKEDLDQLEETTLIREVSEAMINSINDKTIKIKFKNKIKDLKEELERLKEQVSSDKVRKAWENFIKKIDEEAEDINYIKHLKGELEKLRKTIDENKLNIKEESELKELIKTLEKEGISIKDYDKMKKYTFNSVSGWALIKTFNNYKESSELFNKLKRLKNTNNWLSFKTLKNNEGKYDFYIRINLATH